MSYEIVRNINEKKRTITSACNNIRPLIYETYHYKEDMSVNEFRASVITDLLWGNYHYSNTQHIYNLVAAKVKASEEYKDLEEKIWNWNDTYTHEWVKDNYENNVAELKKLIIKTYGEVEKSPKEKWVLTNGWSYIKRINKWTYSYSQNKEKAMIFGNKTMAENSAKLLGDYWKPLQIAG